MFKGIGRRIFSGKNITAVKAALPTSLDKPAVSKDFFEAKENKAAAPVDGGAGTSSSVRLKGRKPYHSFLPVDDGRTHY